MSERLTRKEMKTDEVREVFDRGILGAGENWRRLVAAAVALAIAGAAFGAFLLYRRSQAEAGAEALVVADRVAGASVDALSPKPDDPKQPTFASESERDAAARSRYSELIDHFGGTAAGDAARARLGELEMRGGNAVRARELWREVADGGDDALRATVELSLIALDREEGNLEELATRLEQRIANGKGSLPEDAALAEFATTLEALERPEEAERVWQRIVDDHPASPYGLRAQRKLATDA